MEPDRRFSRSWWLGFVALVLVVPAALVFVDRDLIDRSTPISMEEAEHPILFPDVGPDGVVQVGPGACSVESDEVIVTGRGMTSCRKTEWLMAAHRDYTVRAGIRGIDAGATAVFRLRESGGRRVEVSIGRAAVVLREGGGGAWTVLGVMPRTGASAPISVPTIPDGPRIQRVQIDLVGDQVICDIDDIEIARVRTTITDPGWMSVGAVIPNEVVVRFGSIEVTDTE